MLTVQHLNMVHGVLVLYYGDGGLIEVIRGRNADDEDVEAAQKFSLKLQHFSW